MPAITVAPGGSQVSSGSTVTTGFVVIDEPAVDTGFGATPASTGNPIVTIRVGDEFFSRKSTTIPTVGLPTLFCHFYTFPFYEDPDVGIRAPSNNLVVAPVMITGIVGSGVPICQPFKLVPGISTFFTIRAPMEKLGFSIFRSYDVTPGEAWTMVEYTISASQ